MRRRTRPRWEKARWKTARWERARRAIAPLIALLLIAAACGGDSDDAEPEATTTTTPQLAEEAQDEPDTTEPAENEEVAVSATFAADATELTGQFRAIEADTYRVDTLGIPLSLTVEGEWWVQPNDTAFTVLTDPGSMGPGDMDIVFQRVSGLNDPTNPGVEAEPGEGWPIDDIEGWLDNVVDGIVSGEPRTETIGGREAVVFDVVIADDEVCGPAFCVGFTTNSDVTFQAFERDFNYRVHWFDMGEYAPLLIVVGWPADDDSFLATAETALATLAFGDPGPNPLQPDGDLIEIGLGGRTGPGLIDLPIADGIQIELADERDIFFFPGAAVITLGFEPGDVEILRPVADSAGAPIGTIDEVVAAIEDMGTTMTEIDGIDVALGSARVFDLEGGDRGSDSSGIAAEEGTDAGWLAPALGRVWLFDTERGVVMVTAEAPSGDEDSLASALALAEEILPAVQLGPEPDGVKSRSLTEVLRDGEASSGGTLLPPGTYTSDLLGNDLLAAWRVTDDLLLRDELPGLFAFAASDLGLEFNESVAVFTATGVATIGDASASEPLPDDLAVYLDEHPNVEITDSGESQVGNLTARWWDLTTTGVDDAGSGCPFGNCVAVFAHATVGNIVVGDAWSFRLWEIPDPDGTVFALVQVAEERFDALTAAAEAALSDLYILPLRAPAEIDESNLDDLGRNPGPDAVTLESGEYTSEALPMPLTLEVTSPINLGFVQNGFIELLSTDTAGPFTAVVLVDPPFGVADPADIGGPEGPPEFIPIPDDLETWIDEIPQIEAFGSGSGEIGGVESTYVDVRAVGAPERRGTCGADSCFVLFDWASGPWVLVEGSPQRLWLVPHPEGTIIVAIETDEDLFEDWLDESQALIDGISFG